MSEKTTNSSSVSIDLPWILRTWRTQVAGLTQQHVSGKILQSSHSALCAWESGASRVPVERLRDLDRVYAAGGALFDLAMAVGTPKALPPRTVWTHNFSESGGPVWMWLRPTPEAGRVCVVARWAAFAYDCDEACDDRGIFCTARTSMANPAVWVTLPEPGWVDFGEGELPAALGLRQVDAMSVCRVVGDGHSTAGLVAPPVVERFLSDATFADEVIALFARSPEVVRSIFCTRGGWDRIDDLTGSGRSRSSPSVGPLFTDEQYRALRKGRGLSKKDAATLAAELLPDERDSRGRVRTVTEENVRGVEEGRDPRPCYLCSRLDCVYRADGRTCIEAVEPERRGNAHVFDFPAFWIGPVWFAVEASDDQPGVVRIDWDEVHKEIRVADRVVVTCRRPIRARHPFVVSCPAGWRVTGGMGFVAEAEDVNLGWHREAGPEREGTINQTLLEAFGVTRVDWDELLRRHDIKVDIDIDIDIDGP
jgi:hypothetical protein